MILVTGATGRIGGEVVRGLHRLDVPVRALVHTPEKAASIALPGVEIVNGDFANPDDMKSMVRGIDKVFLLSPSGPDQPELEGHLVDAAVAGGVRHIVKLSVLGATSLTTIALNRWHWESEHHIEETNIPYTFLRPHFFMQNCLMFAPTIAAEGRFYAPLTGAKMAMVDLRDIASVAVAVLTNVGHEYRAYDITGATAITYDDIAAALTGVLAKPVRYVNVPLEAARDALLDTGAAEWLADDMVEYFRFFNEGYGESVSSTIRRVARKEPICVDQFAADYADAFRAGAEVGRAA